jgi:prolyl 4-hydroxylase
MKSVSSSLALLALCAFCNTFSAVSFSFFVPADSESPLSDSKPAVTETSLGINGETLTSSSSGAAGATGITSLYVPPDVRFNITVRTRPHPQVVNIPGPRTTACAAKFLSLSSRPLDMYWDDGRQGVGQGRLQPGMESTTNSYAGHVFYFTEQGSKDNEIQRVTIEDGKTFYPIYDPASPGDAAVIARTLAEESFNEDYFRRTGLRYRHYFGPDGPRAPPQLSMWPADVVGRVHGVTSTQGYWSCSDSNDCQSDQPLEVEVECVSLAPRAFIVENFLSDFEADYLISIAKDKVKVSSVGNSDGGGVRMSETRTSRNTWIPRPTSNITDSISRRVADVLRLDENILVTSANSEDMQVVHYKDGQKYDSHHDWGVSGYPESRFITMLMYLNDQLDETAGGETSFPKGGTGGGFKLRPKKGTAAFFYNLLEDGNGDDLSLHAALPVTKGEKWLGNFWIWDPKRK